MKHESPPFKMVIEGGKLVPATAYDAERLDTYRRGTKVNVVMVRDGGRVMERKWFAILGLVVKQCNVPWTNKEQASEAVKLALGIVNLSKTVGGEFMAYPKSLVELTDPELDEAVRDMMDLIQKMTGIDPATLKKEAADVGEDETEPSDPATPQAVSGEGSGDTQVPSRDLAADQIASPAGETNRAAQTEAMETASATGQQPVGAVSHNSLSQESGPEAGEHEVAQPASPLPASDLITLKREAIDKFLAAATDPTIPSAKDRQETVVSAKDSWKQALPDHLDFVKACTDTANKVVKGELKELAARRYLEGLL